MGEKPYPGRGRYVTVGERSGYAREKAACILYTYITSNYLPRRRKYNVREGSLIDPSQAAMGVIKKFSHVNGLNGRPRRVYIHIYLVNNIIRDSRAGDRRMW